MVMVALKTGRIEKGRVLLSDASITLAQSESSGPDSMLWMALDKNKYEVRFKERSPFNDSAAPETILPGEIRTVSDKVAKGRYKYSVYRDGKETHDPEVVIV